MNFLPRGPEHHLGVGSRQWKLSKIYIFVIFEPINLILVGKVFIFIRQSLTLLQSESNKQYSKQQAI